MGWRWIVPGALAVAAFASVAQAAGPTDASYFEGRWTFVDEICSAPTSWTMIAGGNFVSEDLVGTWAWQDGKLVLSLNDLAVDEETGEAGGRFRMDGPVTVVDRNRFDLMIAPDVYQMQRCVD
ncbi:hypothetical protein C8024_19260 [Sphingopyxis sp. BSNA05]|uniref:hypothetical protein n=1 Tax=Sphingopyxis sp. BSNA05 TaxID=1236614 RepID=UPI0015654605|nr:hypothetical protein [Sphingopyxis sp. BSNA05]NRD91126.1 hypothetical protein [Sphingopyxis sp. BSNA05]